MPRVAFRQIRTRGIFLDQRAFRREVEQTIDRKSKPELIQAHNRVVANWENKPVFKARKRIRKIGITIFVFASGEAAQIWRWVTGGTKGGYKIPKRARKAGNPLRFKTGYKPKTAAVGKFGGPGVSTGPWASAHQVTHPGIEARRFEEAIADDYKRTFARDIENAMRRGLRRARRR